MAAITSSRVAALGAWASAARTHPPAWVFVCSVFFGGGSATGALATTMPFAVDIGGIFTSAAGAGAPLGGEACGSGFAVPPHAV